MTPEGAPQTMAANSAPGAAEPEAEVGGLQGSMSAREVKKERPKSILALFEYAYSEAGRRLTLARKDLRQLTVGLEATQAEIDAVRQMATEDPWLAVPPSLLASLAELGAEPPVRRRVLELVLVSLSTHRVFAGRLERLADVNLQPPLTALEVSDAAKRLTFDALGLNDAEQLKEAARERLRVNAVTAFALFRVLHDGWTSERFIADMSAVVWNAPIQRNASKVAATLATAKNAEALSQLSRQFEKLLRESHQETLDARAQVSRLELLVQTAEESSRVLADELDVKHLQIAEMKSEVADLAKSLAAEQSSRVVDTSHLVDDYELLRTRVIRRLTSQIELLSDGLHALRHGSPEVTDEYLDRALSAFRQEVDSLRERGDLQ